MQTMDVRQNVKSKSLGKDGHFWIQKMTNLIDYFSTAERRVPELIPVLDSQPAGDVSHKPGGRLPLLSARPAVTPATLNRAATNFSAW